jgi:hypothetical protein
MLPFVASLLSSSTSSTNPLSLFRFVSICSDCFPSSNCVILINFFYDSFCKDFSSNIFHKVLQWILDTKKWGVNQCHKTLDNFPLFTN